MRNMTFGNSCVILFALLVNTVVGSADSVGPNGINSSALAFTGVGIGIGQVEISRPGDPTFDTMGGLVHSSVDPAGVFFRSPGSFTATMDTAGEISAHALQVAGVMISSDPTATGVAENASLFSIATNPVGPTADDFDTEAALAAQHIATRNGGDVRAINMSFGNPMAASTNLDGTSLLTSFVDWSASAHDTLYVIAGNQAGPVLPVPTDSFNGITVGFTRKMGGVYREVDPDNVFTNDAFGSRTSVDLIAPGRDVELTTLGSVSTTPPHPPGTSFAAPHVTGTVALLQELGDGRITAGATGWDADARRHEVMKAVLMNSADKLKDDGTLIAVGKLLGMEKTILDTSGNNWIASDAFSDILIPLDDEMGTGQLNAKRALQQFLPGEFDSDIGLNTVPTIGWDYGHTAFDGDFNRYLIDTPLTEGDLISITLAWDREIKLTVDDGVFSAGDTFVGSSDPNTADDQINDLDLFLVPLNTFTPELESGSFVGTVEHIFAQMPFDGEYEIWVQQQDDDIAGGQDYGLAWWYGLAPEITIPIAGDFDGNGMVDAADLAQWEGDYGINGDSDADGDGDSDGADFLVWQQNFGTGVALAANSTAVPEPTSRLLLATGLAFWCPRSSRDRMSRKQTLL